MNDFHICERCGDVFGKFKALFKHIRLKHAHEHNFSITCGIKNCKRSYRNVQSYRSHLYCTHRDIMNDSKDTDNVQQRSQENDQPMEIDDDDGDMIGCLQESSGHTKETTHHLASFLLKLKERFHIPEAGLDDIFEELLFLLERQFESFAKNQDKEGNVNIDSYQTVRSQETEVLKQALSTAYKRNKYWQANFPVILPKEVTFKRTEAGQKVCAHYVPVNDVLTKYISNIDVYNAVNKPFVTSETHLQDVFDGSFFSELVEENTIYLQLYSDEFEVCNPLGAKRLLHKLLGVYYSVLNVPAKFRSKLENIHLAMLAKHTLVKEYGIQAVLKPLLENLKEVEDSGIFVYGKHYKVVVMFLSGDNLGSHAIGGFSQCFSSGRICRFCMASKDDINTKFEESDFVLRTHAVHETHLASIEADSTLVSTYGVNERCVLDELKYFKVSKSLPPDSMHDILEGSAGLVIKCILKSLINDDIITLDSLNESIKCFPYHQSDKPNKPLEIKRNMIFGDSHFKGSATQSWCLLRLLPLLIGESIPEGNMEWQVFLLFRKITDIIFAPVVPKSYLPYLSVCIYDFLCQFAARFPMTRILPKMHYLIHYPNLMLKFGPMVRVWSMRFESKHAYFKSVAASVKCFMNISLTLSKRYQFLQALQFSSSTFLNSSALSSGLIDLKKEFLPQQMLAALEDLFHGEIPNENLAQANSVVIDCVEYKVGGTYFTDFEDDLPNFLNVSNIVLVGKNIFLYGKLFTANRFCNHFHCYFVNQKGYKLVKPEELVDFHVLPLYIIKGEKAVVMKYTLFNE